MPRAQAGASGSASPVQRSTSSALRAHMSKLIDALKEAEAQRRKKLAAAEAPDAQISKPRSNAEEAFWEASKRIVDVAPRGGIPGRDR